MDQSQIVSYAQQLKSLIENHDRATHQLLNLDSKLEKLTQMLFQAEVNGKASFILQITRKISITKGIHYMYETYRKQTWTNVLELSNLITKSLDIDGSTSMTITDVAMDTPSTERRPEDVTVQRGMEHFCVSYRYS